MKRHSFDLLIDDDGEIREVDEQRRRVSVAVLAHSDIHLAITKLYSAFTRPRRAMGMKRYSLDVDVLLFIHDDGELREVDEQRGRVSVAVLAHCYVRAAFTQLHFNVQTTVLQNIHVYLF